MPISRRTAFLACVPVALLAAGLLWPKRDPFADGKTALARVPALRKGMTFGQAAETLHPERLRRASSVAYSAASRPDGTVEQIHALTSDRYLVSRWRHRTKAGDPRLLSWRVETGEAPREDVVVAPPFQIGPIVFPF